jgi:hypothetical protein
MATCLVLKVQAASAARYFRSTPEQWSSGRKKIKRSAKKQIGEEK